MSPEERKEIVNEIISGLEAKGLTVVPASLLNNLSGDIKAKSLLQQKMLTPYQIAKFKLIPGVTSMLTVKNMTVDGRIGKKEFYTIGGKMYIMTAAVKRLRGEK